MLKRYTFNVIRKGEIMVLQVLTEADVQKRLRIFLESLREKKVPRWLTRSLRIVTQGSPSRIDACPADREERRATGISEL